MGLLDRSVFKCTTIRSFHQHALYCAAALLYGKMVDNSIRARRVGVTVALWTTNEPIWLRELDLNQRPSGYEPDELPGCSIPRLLV